MDELKTCPDDCTRCTPQQRLLCAAQFSMMNARRIEKLETRLERLERLQGDNGGVFDPTKKELIIEN